MLTVLTNHTQDLITLHSAFCEHEKKQIDLVGIKEIFVLKKNFLLWLQFVKSE